MKRGDRRKSGRVEGTREEGYERKKGGNNCDKRGAGREMGSVLGQHSDRAD